MKDPTAHTAPVAHITSANSNRAYLIVGGVRHQRLHPVKHGFSYPAWALRIPVRQWSQHPPTHRWLSLNRFNLFSVHHADYGDPTVTTHRSHNLLEKIQRLLTQQGIHDADGEIWLHTFPRMLGYVFNPVSFWFCERQDGSLRAIVCEVNNTFGERHCYLLVHADGRAIKQGETLVSQKILHVSPFCRVEGHYTFRFMNLARDQRPRSIACIDYHSPEHTLLNTSLHGEWLALSDSHLLRMLWQHRWFSLMVMVRIHWQALRLWLKRVPFFHKPVPPSQFVSSTKVPAEVNSNNRSTPIPPIPTIPSANTTYPS